MPQDERSRDELVQENRELTRRTEALEQRVSELEGALRQAGDQGYRDLVENLNDVIYAIGTDGVLTYVSPSVQDFIGYAPEEVIGQPFGRFVHPEELTHLRKRFQALLDGEPSADVYRAVHRSGEVRWMRTSSRPITEGGRVVGVQGVLADVTEQKLAEGSLADSERHFRELAEMLPEVVFETDLKGDLTYANRKAFDLFGYSQAHFDRGLNALEMIALPDRPQALENIRRIIRQEETEAHEYTAITRQGRSLPVLIHSSPIVRNSVVRGLRGVLIDLTEQKRAEQMQAEANDQLEYRVRERTAELEATNRQLGSEVAERREAERALHESQAFLRALLEAPSDLIALLDCEGVVLDLNTTLADSLGARREALVGRPVWDLFPPDVAAHRRPHFEEVLEQKRAVRFEDEREGTWLDNVLWPILNDAGEVKAVAVIGRDITARRMAERVLKEVSGAAGEEARG